MEWTKEKPAKPGFYWWRLDGYADPQVVELYRSSADTWHVMFTGTDESRGPEDVGGQFWPEILTAPRLRVRLR